MFQRLIHDPLMWKLAIATVICVSLFVLAVGLFRRIRRSIASEAELPRVSAESGVALAYGGVIQKLREQEKELQRTREKEQELAAAAEQISETVISNLSVGVIFFDRLGVVRQINRAGKSILGYASPFSFHIRDLFRGVTRIQWPEGEEAHSATPLVQAMQQTLRDGAAFPRAKVDYLTPSGHKRVLRITAMAVTDKSGDVLGLSCLLDDLTEVAELSREAERNENLASLGEISAGLIHDFQKSLTMIRDLAQRLMRQSPDATAHCAAETIVAEVESLSRLVSEFLEFASSSKSSSN